MAIIKQFEIVAFSKTRNFPMLIQSFRVNGAMIKF